MAILRVVSLLLLVFLLFDLATCERVHHNRFFKDILVRKKQKPFKKNFSLSDAKNFLTKYGYMPQYKSNDNKWEFIDWQKLKYERSSSSKTNLIQRKPQFPHPHNNGIEEPITEEFTVSVDYNNDLMKTQEEMNRDDYIVEEDVLEEDNEINQLEEKTENIEKEENDDQIIDAVNRFQKRFNLPITGKLDTMTAELMQRPRCGVPDNMDTANSLDNTEAGTDNSTITQHPKMGKINPLRSMLTNNSFYRPSTGSQNRFRRGVYMDHLVEADIYQSFQYMYETSPLLWRITKYSQFMTENDQIDKIVLAIRQWDEVIPLNFMADDSSPEQQIHIKISFDKGDPEQGNRHSGCNVPFGENELSHAWSSSDGSGEIHLNDDFAFCSTTGIPNCFLLSPILSHEMGHILGLGHSENNESIMHSFYKDNYDEYMELGLEERELVTDFYGKCSGHVTTGFDYVRKSAKYPYNYVYNSYFFRDDFYWMYENGNQRPRYGDPLNVTKYWSEMNNLDAYIHIWDGSTSVCDTRLLFKGSNCYVFSSTHDIIDYGPIWEMLPNSPVELHSGIDAGYYDRRNGHIYLFKGDKVYEYDSGMRVNGALSGANYDCSAYREHREGSVYNIEDLFIPCYLNDDCQNKYQLTEEDEENITPLPSNIDTAYYSVYYDKLFFMKGPYYWTSAYYTRKIRTENAYHEVIGPFHINQRWKYICDVGNL